jgi:hypothetical protein
MSEAGDDLYAASSVRQPAATSGFTRKVETQSVFGRVPSRNNPRKFKYDIFGARAVGGSIKFHVTKDDRLSVDDAAQRLHNLHVKYGIHTEDPEKLLMWDSALFFHHTLNGGSVLQPGRSGFTVFGQHFDFADIRDYLGPDLRRFFRAFADEITAVNRQVLREWDPNDLDSHERHSMLLAVAADRGMSRNPEYCHDSADACTDLDPATRAAIAQSKKLVLSGTVNAADRIHASARMDGVAAYDVQGVSVLGRGDSK